MLSAFGIGFMAGVARGAKDIREGYRSELLLDKPKIDDNNLWILPLEVEKYNDTTMEM